MATVVPGEARPPLHQEFSLNFQPILPFLKPGVIDKNPIWFREIRGSTSARKLSTSNILNHELGQLLDEYNLACSRCVQNGWQCVVAPRYKRCAKCTWSIGINYTCNLDVPSVLADLAMRYVFLYLHSL